MPVKAITEFLGVGPCQDGVVNPDIHYFFQHKSEKLKYDVRVLLDEKCLYISADFSEPFGAKSLFEICVEFDTVGIETEPKFYGERKILVCRKNYPKDNDFKTLMMVMWDDGELSVWPNNYIPENSSK